MDKDTEKAVNEQINRELYSAYLYLSMAAYFEAISLPGFANWMRVQFDEEQFHAFKMFDFITERNGRVNLVNIEQPPAEWKSPLDVFEEVCKHESKVTGHINDLVDLAISKKDHATNNFLQWFVSEQVEEEATAGQIRDQLKLAGGNGGMLFMMDKEMATRVFTPPVAAE